jgi:putative transposase
MMYPLVRELAVDGIPVAVRCGVLKIARQPLTCPVTGAEFTEAYLANALFDAHRDDPEFGYRFLADEACDVGYAACDRTMWRVCSDNGWWSAFGKKRGKNGKKPGPPVHDDLVKRDFTAEAPNQLWLADITEHRTGEGKLYLCAIKDVFSNRIVGYSISDRMKSRLAVDALSNAVARRGGEVAGCVLHTDRGPQFRSRRFVHALNLHDMVGSMGKVGAAGDNAAMEMLRSVSSGHRSRLKRPEEVPGVVPLQAPHRHPLRLSFAGPTGDVVLGRLVVLRARQDHGVQGPGSAGDRRRVRDGVGFGSDLMSLPAGRPGRVWRTPPRRGTAQDGTTTPGSEQPSARRRQAPRATRAPSRGTGSSPPRVRGTRQ